MVTVFRDGVVGQLWRWVWNDGEVACEVRIDEMEDHGGICDAAAFSIASCAALARVANEVRFEWKIISGVDEGSIRGVA